LTFKANSPETVTNTGGPQSIRVTDRNLQMMCNARIILSQTLTGPPDPRLLAAMCTVPFQSSMLAQLIPMNGGAPITLTKPITVVGRSSRLCDLAVDHHSVSKLHCILVKTDGLIYMRDLGSTNGTRVNGQRVLRGALLPGDQISFSGAVYKVHLGPDPQLSAGGIMFPDPTDLSSDIPEIVLESSEDIPLVQPKSQSLTDSGLLPAD
jgi:hypothetical protein